MDGAGAAPPLVVVNPTASRLVHGGRRDRIVEAVAAAVEARTGRSASVVDTTPEAARDALAAAGTSPLVTAVGGDGTVREVAAAMAGSGVPLAIVPAGTGNVFAAALGIPRRTDAAIRLVETGQPSPVDLGRAAWGPTVGGEPGPEEGSKAFVVACGLGFDARVMTAATTDLKHRHGFRAYVYATLHEATRLRPTTFRIEADGDMHELRGLVVLIANCGQIIPGFIGPRRSIDASDGLLDVMVVRAAGIPGGLAGAADLLLADDDTPRSRRHSLRLQAQHVRVTADPPEPVEIDGDPHEADWLEATVLPGAISVLRP